LWRLRNYRDPDIKADHKRLDANREKFKEIRGESLPMEEQVHALLHSLSEQEKEVERLSKQLKKLTKERDSAVEKEKKAGIDMEEDLLCRGA
jgi:chromosome segregation ATPase